MEDFWEVKSDLLSLSEVPLRHDLGGWQWAEGEHNIADEDQGI